MTSDEASVDPEIIDLLKGDARSEVPPDLDQRVATRLAASAGIFGLSTAVTAGSQAAAVSAASATAASTTAVSTAVASTAAVVSVPAMTLLTFGSLAKTLAFGMALGSTVGLGLHLSFRNAGAPVAPARAAGSVVAPPAAATTAPSRRSGVAAEAPSVAEPVSETPPAAPPRAAEPRTNPSPELPSAAAPSLGTGLAAQQALLDDARAALRRGDGSRALAAIGRHIAQFPSTAFEEEREAVAIKAFVLVGNASEARARTERFDVRFPKSLHTSSLRAALGENRNTDSVTDPSASGQTPSEQ